MAEHGSTTHGAMTHGDPALDAAFVKDREAMLGGFISAMTYATGAVIVLLILMAIFLI